MDCIFRPFPIVLVVLGLWGLSLAEDVEDPFLKDPDLEDVLDVEDIADLEDASDGEDVYDGEDPYDALDSLTQDTPDTYEISVVGVASDSVVAASDTVAVQNKKKKLYYKAVHAELSVVTADATRDIPFKGGYVAAGVSIERFFYKLSTIYAMAIVSGVNVGSLFGIREYEDDSWYVPEPFVETSAKTFISVPLTIESKLDFFLWNFLYDFGFETDFFFWECKKRSNSFHETTDYWYGVRPAVYVVFGAGNFFSLKGHRIEYIVRTTHSLFGYHVGKKREVRVGASFNFWL